MTLPKNEITQAELNAIWADIYPILDKVSGMPFEIHFKAAGIDTPFSLSPEQKKVYAHVFTSFFEEVNWKQIVSYQSEKERKAQTRQWLDKLINHYYTLRGSSCKDSSRLREEYQRTKHLVTALITNFQEFNFDPEVFKKLNKEKDDFPCGCIMFWIAIYVMISTLLFIERVA